MAANALDSRSTSPQSGTVERLSPRREPVECLGLAALVLLAPAAVIYLSFSAGGYFPSAPAFVAIVLAQALVVRCVLADRPFEGFTVALAVPLSALTLYAAWELASALWSGAPAQAMDAYDRTLLYVLALTLFGSLRGARRRRWLLYGLEAGLAAVCVIGLISRLLPHTWPTANTFFDDRLNYPLTYWNAEGMLATIALILAFHLCCQPTGRRWVKPLAALLTPAIATTLLLTFSRGALGVAIVGLVAYCLLTRARTLPGAVIALAPTSAVALHSAYDATLLASSRADSPAGVAQGHHVALVVALCMLAAAVLRALTALADPHFHRLGADARLTLLRTLPRRAERAALAAAALVAVVLVALTAGAGHYVHREYDQFVHGTKGPGGSQTRERLTSIANDGRLPLWKVALRIYATDPLHGTGAETYQQYYPHYRTEATYVTDAHSLYLQSLAELGVVGLALIALVVGGILVGLLVRIRGPDRALYAALSAIAFAWALHQAVDWDWEMPAVTLPIFILAGIGLARPADGRVGLRGLPASRAVVALAWLIVALAPLLVSISYTHLQNAGQALKADDCAAARADALSSLSASAQRPQAYTILGVCDLRQGFARAAVTAMAQAADYEPHSWEEQYWLAVALAATGSDPRPTIARALALNPLEPLLEDASKRLDVDTPSRWEAAAGPLREQALSSGKFSISSL